MVQSSVKIYNFILLVLFLFGLGLLAYGIFNGYRSMKAESWPVAEGIILTSQIERSISNGERRYRAIIRYSYQVNGNTYQNNRVSYVNVSTKGYAEKLVGRYPVDHTVDVYYNPNKPSESVLSAGINFGVALFLLVGVIFTILSSVLWILKDKMIGSAYSVVGFFKREKGGRFN